MCAAEAETGWAEGGGSSELVSSTHPLQAVPHPQDRHPMVTCVIAQGGHCREPPTHSVASFSSAKYPTLQRIPHLMKTRVKTSRGTVLTIFSECGLSALPPKPQIQ